MTIVVHHLETSRSHRVLWLFEELELAYELKTYARDPKTMRSPKSACAIHPRGRFPMVEYKGHTLAESGAIIEEVLDDHPRLRPEPGTEAHRRYRYFLHYAEGSLMSPLLVSLITGQLRTKDVPFLVRPIAKAISKNIDAAFTTPELRAHVEFLESELKDRPFLAGDELSGADVQMSFPIEALLSKRGGFDASKAPNLTAYLARLQARPAYQTALAKGGPVLM